eukprot:gene8783-11860_t
MQPLLKFLTCLYLLSNILSYGFYGINRVLKESQQSLFFKSHNKNFFLNKKEDNKRDQKLYSTTIARSTTTIPPFDTDKKMKLGVLLLNLGGPGSMKDVEGFLYNLFADPDIIRLPSALSILQKPIAWVIAKRRAPKSSMAYESIGGGSPIVKYTQAQADGIKLALEKRGIEDVKCYFAMRYWHPYTEEVLDLMQSDERNTLVIVPLYPQYSISTSGSSLKLLQEIFYSKSNIWGQDKVAHTVVPAWYYRPGYLKVMAKLIIKELEKYSLEEMHQGVHVLFSAHGVPISYIAAGDPYQRQIEECVKLVAAEVTKQLTASLSVEKGKSNQFTNIDQRVAMQLAGMSGVGVAGDIVDEIETKVVENPRSFEKRIEYIVNQFRQSISKGGNDAKDKAEEVSAIVETDDMSVDDISKVKEVQFHLSFQSRVGPVKWLTPYTEEKLIELGSAGVKNLIVVPVSFVSEHIETLEEIDMEYKEVAEHNGITHWTRVPALNTDQSFLDDMAEMVIDALESPTVTVSEAAARNSADMIDTSDINSSKSLSFGMTDSAEKINGRFAMLGIIGTTIVEFINGHSVLQMVGLK